MKKKIREEIKTSIVNNRHVHGKIIDRTYSEDLQFDLALTHPRSGEPDCRSQL